MLLKSKAFFQNTLIALIEMQSAHWKIDCFTYIALLVMQYLLSNYLFFY